MWIDNDLDPLPVAQTPHATSTDLRARDVWRHSDVMLAGDSNLGDDTAPKCRMNKLIRHKKQVSKQSPNRCRVDE